jgi:putative addiction module component (TIGR02574 family)
MENVTTLNYGTAPDTLGAMPTRKMAKAGIFALSIPERLQLVEDIWDSIAHAPRSLLLTDAQKTEIDRRLAAYRKNPNAGSPWVAVRKRLRKSL